jgi:sodium-dependent dicarboxylate transporter 2/3/5
VHSLDDKARDDFQYALLLGVAYGATIGGMATLVGTLPNAMLAAFMLETYGTEIDFARWMMIGVPLAIVMLPLAWLALTRWAFTVNFETSGEGKAALKQMHDELGRITVPETRVAIVFSILVVAWVGRPMFAMLPGLSALDDSGIAMAGAIALFLIPSGDKTDPLLIRWQYIERLPWNVLLLFGGGLTLAGAVSQSGLAEWIGNSLQGLTALPLAGLVIIAASMIILLTEFTSNTATTATFLPIVGAIAVAASIDPIVLAVPITLAASCAFMLPVATPPNAIVFGSGMLTIPKMIRAGIVLILVGIVIVSLVAIFLAPLVFS